MIYSISHQIEYNYNQPVVLQPHLLRLRPRCDGWQKLHEFSLIVTPEPQSITDIIDLDGNSCIQLRFNRATEKLGLNITSKVETYKTNPFDYFLESWALKLPLDYPSSLLSQLKPYLQPYNMTLDPVAVQLAQEIADEVQDDTGFFVTKLTQCIYENCEYLIRETGEPWPPGMTWNKKQGSCRDFVVLFMEVCRAAGLATRFVSGYEKGDPDAEKHLHAWAEIYIPGGGWRGFDPTHGLAVANTHIAVAASALPNYTAPFPGIIEPLAHVVETGKPASWEMKANIIIDVWEN